MFERCQKLLRAGLKTPEIDGPTLYGFFCGISEERYPARASIDNNDDVASFLNISTIHV